MGPTPAPYRAAGSPRISHPCHTDTRIAPPLLLLGQQPYTAMRSRRRPATNPCLDRRAIRAPFEERSVRNTWITMNHDGIGDLPRHRILGARRLPRIPSAEESASPERVRPVSPCQRQGTGSIAYMLCKRVARRITSRRRMARPRRRRSVPFDVIPRAADGSRWRANRQGRRFSRAYARVPSGRVYWSCGRSASGGCAPCCRKHAACAQSRRANAR
jgi:hypothetical protein